LTLKLLAEVVVPVKVRPLKARDVPEFDIDPPVIVIVPAEGLKVAVLELIRAPATLKEDAVVTVAPDPMVSPWKTRLVVAPPLLTIDPPVLVMVPPVGAKVIPAFTVRAPETLKEVLY